MQRILLAFAMLVFAIPAAVKASELDGARISFSIANIGIGGDVAVGSTHVTYRLEGFAQRIVPIGQTSSEVEAGRCDDDGSRTDIRRTISTSVAGTLLKIVENVVFVTPSRGACKGTSREPQALDLLVNLADGRCVISAAARIGKETDIAGKLNMISGQLSASNQTCKATFTGASAKTNRPGSRKDGVCTDPAISYVKVRGGDKNNCIGAGCYVFENSCASAPVSVTYRASDGLGSNCSVTAERKITVPRGAPGLAIDFSCSQPQVTRAEFTK